MAVARGDQAGFSTPRERDAQSAPPRPHLALVANAAPALAPRSAPPGTPGPRRPAPRPRQHAPAPAPARVLAPTPPTPTPAPVVVPATAPATLALGPPAVRRMAVGEQRFRGSLSLYLALLLTGAAVAVAVSVRFATGAAAGCSGGDAVNDCLLHQVVAPGVTRFALILAASHLLALLVADVLPGARRKRRAGYRLRRQEKVATPLVPEPGMPLDPLAAATWAPVQQPRHAALAPRTARAVVARAVCPACMTIVPVQAGGCVDCGGAVVPRRG
jgi:hypothetical protein